MFAGFGCVCHSYICGTYQLIMALELLQLPLFTSSSTLNQLSLQIVVGVVSWGGLEYEVSFTFENIRSNTLMAQLMTITHSLVLQADFTWSLLYMALKLIPRIARIPMHLEMNATS